MLNENESVDSNDSSLNSSLNSNINVNVGVATAAPAISQVELNEEQKEVVLQYLRDNEEVVKEVRVDSSFTPYVKFDLADAEFISVNDCLAGSELRVSLSNLQKQLVDLELKEPNSIN